MKTYYVSLHIKTPVGFLTYGSFELGTDRKKATTIFRELKGTDEISESSILHLDFTELEEGIPLPIQVLHCTIDEIAENVRIITREVFKELALKTE
ncbi:MAG: hypothetical protein JWP78_2210 [Mucilaginibacter sp.]|nr:hypothetical protein [Mucilaginibacter sp.]